MADSLIMRCHDARRSCTNIQAQASARLRSHSHFCGRMLDLTFELRGDVLIIRGRLPSFYLKQLVQTVLREIEHVKRIENYVDVVASNGLSSVQGRSVT
jgi:hypothetical protein